MRFLMRGKLGNLLGLLLLLTVVVGGAGLWYVQNLSSELTVLYAQNIRGMADLANAERGLWELRLALPDFQVGDVDAREHIEKSQDADVRRVTDAIAAFAALPLTQRERELLIEYTGHFDRYIAARPKYFALVAQGKAEEATDFRERRTNPPAAEAVRTLGELIELQRKLADARAASVQSEATFATRIMIGLLVAALTLGVVLSGSLARYVAERVAEALTGVQQSSSELEATAAQQVASARELSSATAEISVTVRELLATSRQISETARSVAIVAEETGTSARSGDGKVKLAQEALATMRKKVDETVGHMLDLGKRSQQIGGILELINELAEQTNILSINARIEAAGSSDAGRRFGVVADEIRRLADRVGSSSREIRGLVDEIRAAANTTVMATEDGAKAVDLGARHFDEVLRTFQMIAERIDDTSAAARQIELSTTQQVGAVEQVNIAMADVVRSAKETESGSQHTLQTCERLAGIARDLATLAGHAARPLVAPPRATT